MNSRALTPAIAVPLVAWCERMDFGCAWSSQTISRWFAQGCEVAAHLEFAGFEIRVVLYAVRDLVGEPIVGGPNKDQVLDERSIDALMTAIRQRRTEKVASRAN